MLVLWWCVQNIILSFFKEKFSAVFSHSLQTLNTGGTIYPEYFKIPGSCNLTNTQSPSLFNVFYVSALYSKNKKQEQNISCSLLEGSSFSWMLFEQILAISSSYFHHIIVYVWFPKIYKRFTFFTQDEVIKSCIIK